MMSLILTLSMIPAATAAQTAQVQTCVWPHVCQTAPVAQVQTCVWPHVCNQNTQEAPVLPILTSQVQTCVWPHVCKDATKA